MIRRQPEPFFLARWVLGAVKLPKKAWSAPKDRLHGQGSVPAVGFERMTRSLYLFDPAKGFCLESQAFSLSPQCPCLEVLTLHSVNEPHGKRFVAFHKILVRRVL